MMRQYWVQPLHFIPRSPDTGQRALRVIPRAAAIRARAVVNHPSSAPPPEEPEFPPVEGAGAAALTVSVAALLVALPEELVTVTV